MTFISSVSSADPSFCALLDRHQAFLVRAPANSLLRSTGVFASSVPVQLPQADGSAISQAERLHPDMVDPGALIDAFEAWQFAQSDASLPIAIEISRRQTLVFPGLGDLLPFSQPFFKIPWLEAILGCPIKMTEGQIWVERYEGDLASLIRHGIRLEHNEWFQLYLAFLDQLQARLGTRYPVSANTLFRGPSDLVAALLGVQEACVGWIQEPALMAQLMRLGTDANLALIEAGCDRLEPFAGGYVSGFGTWTPGSVVRAQADHSALLSPQMYEKQILPYDREIVGARPFCIFHIHNNGLHVAPYLAQITELDAVEVVVDPYPTGARKQVEVDMLRWIQETKPLILDVNFPSLEEAAWLESQLSPRGLCLNARFSEEVYRSLPASELGSDFWTLS